MIDRSINRPIDSRFAYSAFQAGYSSNAELYSNFSSLTDRCSDIFRLFQIGSSVNDQPIVVLEATSTTTIKLA